MSYLNRVRRLLEAQYNSAVGFSSLAREMRGTHPSVIRHILLQDSPSKLEFLIEREPKNHAEAETRDNPVLSPWYFTAQSAKMFVDLQNWTGKDVALLGSPTLLPLLSTHARAVTLFDYDPRAKVTNKSQKRNFEVVKCDLRTDSLISFKNRFDVVVMDPPWYTDDYFRWFDTAASLCQPRGFICCSLFPELTRPSAAKERTLIFKSLSRANARTTVYHNFFLYTVPSFEAGQLRSKNLPTAPWKKADLLIVENPKALVGALPDSNRSHIHSSLNPHLWKKIVLPKLTVFIRTAPSEASTDELLLPSEGKDGMLESPSLRSIARRKANVLTSEGHAFISSNTEKLAAILNSEAKGRHDRTALSGVSEKSRNLIRNLTG